MKTKFLLLAALALSTAYVNAQSTTAFTFQGSLDSGGAAVNGSYDLQIAVVDSQSNLIAGPVTNAVGITNGLFSATLDFGSAPFTDGPRYLQIGVRTNGGSAFTELSPLQQITGTPFSITAINLSSPLPATNLSGTVPFASLPSTLVTNLPAGLITNGQSGVTLTGTLSGNGAGLSNVVAASLTGFLPTSQLSGTIPAVQINGVLSPAQLPSSLVTNSAANVSLGGVFNGIFIGTAGGLTNVNAANLVGPVPSNSLTSIPAANLKGVVSLANLPESLVTNLPAGLITNEQTNVTLTGAFIGDGSGLTNLPIPSGLLTNGQSGLNLSGTFSGNGAGLTGISASSLSGTIGLNQLPSGPAGVVVNGESSVNLSGNFNGTFSGNGSSLNSINAGALAGSLPANVLTTTPIPAGNLSGSIPAGVTFSGGVPAGLLTGNSGPVPSSVISGTYSQQVDFSNPGNVFEGTIHATIQTSGIDVDEINNDGNLTNGGDIFITNSTLVNLQVTNGVGHTGVLIDNSGNVTATGIITGDGSGLTGVRSSVLTGPISAAMIPAVNASAITGTFSPAAGTIPGLNLSGALPSTASTIPAAALFGSVPTGIAVPGADLTGTIPDGSLPATYSHNLTFSGAVDFTDPSSTFAGTFTGTIASTGISVQHINNSGNLTNDGDVFITNSIPANLQVTNGVALTGVTIDNGGKIVSTGGSFALTNGTSTGVVMDVAGDIWATGNINVKAGSTITGALTGNATGFTGVLAGDVIGAQGSTHISAINGQSVAGASSGNFVNDLVLRDGSGSFSAGQITASGGSGFVGSGAGLTSIPASQLTGAVAAGVTIDNLTPADIGTAVTQIGTINSTFQIGSQTLSNLVGNPAVIVNGSAASTLPIITGPTTNAGGFWVTNGDLFVTNATLLGGVIIHGRNTNPGNAEFSGTVTAANFSGNGSGLTSVAAGNLTGTIPTTAIPSVYTGTVDFSSLGNSFTGGFIGDGSLLNNLSAASLGGALPDTVTIDGLTPTQAGTELLSIESTFQLGSQTLSNLTANATLPIIKGPSTNAGSLWVTNGTLLVTNATLGLGAIIHGGNMNTGNAEFSGTVTAANFSGNGGGLTGVTAATIAQGAIPSTYSGTVDFSSVGNSFTGSFTGNGAGLTSLTANNLVGQIPQGSIPTPYIDNVSFNSVGNSFTGNGSGLTSLNAASLTGTMASGVTFGAGAFTTTQVGTAVGDVLNTATSADTANVLVKRDAGGNIAVSGLASTSITNVGNITNSGNITNAGNIFVTNDVLVEFSITNGVDLTGVLIDNDGDITSTGGDLVVTNASSTGVLINTKGVQADQFVGNVALGAPNVSAAPGAGSTASATIVGTDASGQITISAAGVPTGTVLATVTFAHQYPSAAYVVISPANLNAAQAPQVWVSGDSSGAPTATGFEIQEVSGAPFVGNFVFNYVVIGQ